MTDKNIETIELIKNQGVLPLFYYNKPEANHQVLDLLYATGIRILEFAMRGEGMLDALKDLLHYRDSKYPDFRIGVGSIKCPEAAHQLAGLDIAFLSSPGMMPALGKLALDHGVLWIPGCMTISEIMEAEYNNASVIKLCPASLLKSSFLVGIKDIFPKLSFIPMGGLDFNRNDLTPWFDAGAIAVSVGSRLLGKTLLENEAYDVIKARLIQANYMIQTIKKYKIEEEKELAELHKKAAGIK